jgi:iron complex transport system permease protein
MKASATVSENRKEYAILIVLGCGLLAVAALALVGGRYAVSLETAGELIRLRLFGGAVPEALRQADAVLFSIRLPRILLAILVGAALAVSGAVYQGIFRNPLVSPDILGVSSGAGVGASLAILLEWPTLALHLTAFGFGLGTVMLVMLTARLVGRDSHLLIMILAGVVISSFFTAIGSLLKYIASTDQTLAAVVLWLMGSLARSGAWNNVLILAVVLAVGVTPLFLLRWRINVLSFGDEEAKAMGVNVRRLQVVVIVCATLLTASSVALCGLVGWVGLIIPHIARFMVGPNFTLLLPVALGGGGLFLLLTDSVIRVLLPWELPVGILLSCMGAPFFLYILWRRRMEWT